LVQPIIICVLFFKRLEVEGRRGGPADSKAAGIA